MTIIIHTREKNFKKMLSSMKKNDRLVNSAYMNGFFTYFCQKTNTNIL
jgi:preprotein translocase subunit YajC